MIIIGDLPRAPYWASLTGPLLIKDKPGKGPWMKVRPFSRPYETAAITAARRAVPQRDQDETEESYRLRAIGVYEELGYGDILRSLGVEAAVAAAVDDLTLKALGRALIVDWSGLVDEDGKPLELTPEHIAAALGDRDVAAGFERAIRAPRARLEREKNGSAPSPDTSATAALSDARDAGSPAMPAAGADASSTSSTPNAH